MKKNPVQEAVQSKKQGYLVQHVDNVCRHIWKSKLAKNFFEKAEPDLKAICDAFGLTKLEAALFSVIMYINFSSETVDLHDFVRYTECSPITAFALYKELDSLVRKQVLKSIKADRKRNRQPSKLSTFEYYVPDTLISECIWNNVKFKPKEVPKSESVFDLFTGLNEQFKSLMEETTTYQEVIFDVQSLLHENSSLQFVQDLNKEMLDDDSLIFFLACCSEYLDTLQDFNLSRIIAGLYRSDIKKQLRVRQSVLNATHPLIEKGLISNDKGSFKSEMAELTERSLKILIPDIAIFKKSKKNTSQLIIPHETIAEKKLFFDPELQGQVDNLTRVLMPENYEALVQRMQHLRMPHGICILLYGEKPGTGKTQLTYQIARMTRRNIIFFDLAFKAKYYGESEANISKAFNYYKDYCSSKPSSEIPILFVNECDAVLSNRKKIGNSSTDQTDNAIQNILLDQIENLSGILIATTNLTINLDPAFERRFLFKIHFETPTIEAKKAIWRDKIPELNDENASILALKFDFSGGQIENVARRYQMIWILEGRHPDLDEVLDLCSKERLYKTNESRKIGYLQ